MGISRDSRHKRRLTGGKRKIHQKKRKFELGRPPAVTRLGKQRVHSVRTRGGNAKFRAMRLDHGNFGWGSEAFTQKTRIMGVMYNASNNEYVRTNTLVKGAVVQIDATPFRQFLEKKYNILVGKKKEGEAPLRTEDPSKRSLKRLDHNRALLKLDEHVKDEFSSGRLLAILTSRPGQCGRADGYILEGPELEFYQKKLQRKKRK